MTLNATGTGLAGWSFEVTAGTNGGFNFADFVYDTTNSVATLNPLLVYGGKRLTTLDIRTTDYPGTSGSHDMALIFEEIPSAIPGAGLLLSVCGATLNCLDTGSGIALESGEAVSNPTPGSPFGVAFRNITGGFLTVSDPPGSISLNFTAEPVLIPVSGGDGTVPEPATLGLAGLGLALALYVPRRHRRPMSS
ncbi:PEP-CTERM sorting domain-containing protein [Roseateles cellulosilyticus]|uniref:PEP-CTERM sorting domain-containing protein n=1 Tax=Pelomonas cellulosilytica TaxID=2906762 RepID=A0ABS8XTG9_9BURK|nr:PEP-CTERM sorting domain-containing protein [Pelomonas sp. P8]MCE4554493.1 PEP-CTERM sorting domain-containing protein [Pelomonas sp. P8]